MALKLSSLGRRVISSLSTPNYREPKEIVLSSRWGKMAGKSWGNPKDSPVLCLHGWLDNAGTYDRIIPHMKKGYHFLALDMVGHGYSEHIPQGINYHSIEVLSVIKWIQQYFNWSQFRLMGHSFGGGISMLYASIFPEEILQLIQLDLISLPALPLKHHSKATRKSLILENIIFERLNSGKVPEYTYEEAVARLCSSQRINSGNSEAITEEAARILLRRGLKILKTGKYTWSADYRLRISSPVNLTPEQILHYSQNLKCPHLIIKGKNSSKFMKEPQYEQLLHFLKNNNSNNFKIVEVDGGHHLHLDHPERAIPIINDFLDDIP